MEQGCRSGLPVLLPVGGGGERLVDVSVYLSPLPGPGELRITAASPARGLAETVTVLAADRLVTAASRAVALWELPDEEHPAQPPPPSVPPGSWFDAKGAEVGRIPVRWLSLRRPQGGPGGDVRRRATTGYVDIASSGCSSLWTPHERRAAAARPPVATPPRQERTGSRSLGLWLGGPERQERLAHGGPLRGLRDPRGRRWRGFVSDSEAEVVCDLEDLGWSLVEWRPPNRHLTVS
jgi:hypothetical protein